MYNCGGQTYEPPTTGEPETQTQAPVAEPETQPEQTTETPTVA